MVKKHPDHRWLLERIFSIHMRLKNTVKALETLVVIDKNHTLTASEYISHALMLNKPGTYDLAETYAKKALTLDPEDEKSYIALLLIHGKKMLLHPNQKNKSEALKFAEKVLSINPQSIRASLILARASDYPENMAAFEKSLKLIQDKKSEGVHTSFTEESAIRPLQRIYAKHKHYQKNIDISLYHGKHAETPTKQADSLFNAFYAYAFMPNSEDTVDERIHLLKKILELDIDTAYKTSVLLRISKQYSSWAKKDYVNAQVFIDKALLISPPEQQQEIIMNWAELLVTQNKHKAAKQLLAEKYTQTQSSAYFMIKSELYEEKENYAEAAKWLKKYLEHKDAYVSPFYQQQYQILFLKSKIKQSPKNAALHNDLGVVYLARKYYANAKQSFEQAIALSPKKAALHYNLGTTYVQQQKWSEAIPYFKQAVLLRPDYQAALYNLGLAYFKTDQQKMAQKTLIQLKMLNPDYKGLKELAAAL